jgi:hypothetical protein
MEAEERDDGGGQHGGDGDGSASKDGMDEDDTIGL